MRKFLLLILVNLSILSSFAQPSGMINETFNLKSIEVGGLFLTPNGETPNLRFIELAGNYVLDADGIRNTLNAAASFNGNSVTFNDFGVTLHDCVEPNCYYENLYFYEILTTPNLESKTLTYTYSERNGYKYLSLRDSAYKWAHFSTQPAPVPDARLFQTWYLYMQEADLGDRVYFPGPNPPQIKIHQDFTYTGIEGCALINGDFILGNGDDIYEFFLQSRNYSTDESNCPPGPVGYAMWELNTDIGLGSRIYEGNDGNDYFEYESYAGFISFFCNALILSTPENNLSEFTFFPNPVQDILNFQSATSHFDAVIITDINGRIVLSVEKPASNEIDVSGLQSGMYFLNVQSSEGDTTKKFIKY